MKVLVSTSVRWSASMDAPPSESAQAAHLCSIERVIGYMRNYSSEPLELSRLATVAGISKFHFIRVFTAITGITPMSYLTSLRLEHAKRLLLGSMSSVTDICQEVGYSSIGSFSDTFTRMVGMPPSRFRDPARKVDLFMPRHHHSSLATGSGERPWLHGRISTPCDTEGTCLLGAFPTGMVAGRPLASACLRESGSFALPMPDCRSFHLIALFLPETASGTETDARTTPYLLAREHIALQTALSAPPVHLTLREPRLTDPPVVLALGRLPFEATRIVA